MPQAWPLTQNYPAEDRSAAMKRFEAGELVMNDDFPTEQLADMEIKFGEQVKMAGILAPTAVPSKLTKPRGTIRNYGTPFPWPSTATIWPRAFGRKR